MKTVIFLALLIGVLSFGKSFVSGINDTASTIQKHNTRIEQFYVKMHKK